jgi:hypothetical protein
VTRRVLRWSAGVCLGATLLGGCSSTTAGSPAPASTGASGGSSSSQPALDAEPYRTKPCELIPADMPASLGFSAPGAAMTEGKNVAVVGGQSCSWNDFSSGAKSIQVQILPKNSDPRSPGISAILNNFKLGHLAYADPTDVLGYQAVFSDIKESRAQGQCSISVAISDTQVVGATTVGFPGADNSCGTAKQLAEAMVKTLGGA